MESSAQNWLMSELSWFDVSSVMKRCTLVAMRFGSSTAFSAFCIQGSAEAMSTSPRTGMEPLALLKATCTFGLIRSAARRFCAASLAASFCFGKTITSPSVLTMGLSSSRPIMQPKSLTPVMPAAANSPRAQSPMICSPALPVITRLVVSFQLRLA